MAMTDDDYAQLKLHSHQSAQDLANGTKHYSELLRLDYLEAKRNTDFQESMALQNAQTSGLAREIVQQRSVATQPPVNA